MSTAKRWFTIRPTEEVIALARLERLNPADHLKIVTTFHDDVLVAPGGVSDRHMSGPSLFVKSRAVSCDNPTQIAEDYGHSLDCPTAADLDTPEGQIIHLITDTSCELDELVVETGLDVKKILGLVTRLELSGRIYQDSAGRYSTKKHG